MTLKHKDSDASNVLMPRGSTCIPQKSCIEKKYLARDVVHAELERLRQEDQEFEFSVEYTTNTLSYTVRPCLK